MVREILEGRKLGRRKGDKKLVCIKIPVRLRDHRLEDRLPNLSQARGIAGRHAGAIKFE